MKSKLIDIFYFGLAGTSGTLSVMSLLADHKASSIILDVLGLIISAYFVIRGFLDIKSENAKLDKNWQILSWIAWSILLIGVCVAIGGYGRSPDRPGCTRRPDTCTCPPACRPWPGRARSPAS